MFQAAKSDLSHVVLVGLVIPALLALTDRWLLDREFYPGREAASAEAMTFFVLQVGIFGVLCGRLIRRRWLVWVLFAWCLLFTDLTASSSLSPQIGKSLFTAQIGLITIWIVLGTSSWKARVPVALALILPIFGLIAQTAVLCLICLVLRSQGFRLALTNDECRLREEPIPAGTPRPIQFGIKDVLLWTTALAPLLAFSRFAVSQVDAQQMLANGVLHSIVLVIALWAALGAGSPWFRWLILAVFIGIAGLTWADLQIYVFDWWRWGGGPPPWFSKGHLDFWLWHWDAASEFLLSGGMLAATLLIYRVLGYRLCRCHTMQTGMATVPAGNASLAKAAESTAATAVIAQLPVSWFRREKISGILAKCGIFWSGFLPFLQCIYGASNQSPLHLSLLPRRTDCQPQSVCGS